MPDWYWWPSLVHLLPGEDGQDLAEYVLLIGFIAVLAIIGVTSLGVMFDGYFRTITERLVAIL